MIRDNFFEVAHNARTGKYGEEDLLTDSLVCLLSLDHELANAFFLATTGMLASVREVRSQAGFEDIETGDSPDMVISTDDVVLIAEHKVDSGLGARQLERYLESAHRTEQESGVKTLVAFIARDRVNISNTVLRDPAYVKPKVGQHFTWRDVYGWVRDSLNRCEDIVCQRLRRQFLEHFEAKGLAPISAPPGFPSLFDNSQLEERNLQQRAFGLSWSAADDWLTSNGFRTSIGSRFELYVYPTDNSNPDVGGGRRWIYMKPTPSGSVPHNNDFLGPYLEVRVCCDALDDLLVQRVLQLPRFDIDIDGGSIPCVTGPVPQGKNRVAASFWFPLAELTDDPERLSSRLLTIVKAIIQRLG